MSLAITYSRASLGIDAPLITIEVHLSNGLPGLAIVGLPETAVRESKDRVRSAIINSQFEFPARKITINLAPADLPKNGSRFDLAIAIGILAASDQLPIDGIDQYEFIGELALSGELRSVNAVLPAAIQCKKAERTLITSIKNSQEAILCKDMQALGASSLLSVCQHLQNQQPLEKPALVEYESEDCLLDFANVYGQHFAKRALEICAAGNHNALLYGPPGTGKTMLASRLPGIMPPLTKEQSVEVACIYSLREKSYKAWHTPPYRKPHHSASPTAIIGGGSTPQPGEISLSHQGVLFLDEFPEFSRQIIENLREPMEAGEVYISRTKAQLRFPAKFILLAAMNPCPCGYFGSNIAQHECSCTPDQIKRYKQKLSGPILDRIDLHIPVNHTGALQKNNPDKNESSMTIRQRVIRAREEQIIRQGKANAFIIENEVEKYCVLKSEDEEFLSHAIETLGLSNRAYSRILKVSRTIADLDKKENINRFHLTEALGFRNFKH